MPPPVIRQFAPICFQRKSVSVHGPSQHGPSQREEEAFSEQLIQPHVAQVHFATNAIPNVLAVRWAVTVFFKNEVVLISVQRINITISVQQNVCSKNISKFKLTFLDFQKHF